MLAHDEDRRSAQDWSTAKAKILTLGVAAFIAMVSIWTPLVEPVVAKRWFAWPNLLWLSPVPLVTLGLFVWLRRALAAKRDAAPHFSPR